MLRGPIAAGTWHLVGDGEGVGAPVTVEFDILWRRSGSPDAIIATVNHDFPIGSGSFRSVMFETDLAASAVPAVAGDQLVLKFKTLSGGTYTPNGDGATAGARDPNLTLP